MRLLISSAKIEQQHLMRPAGYYVLRPAAHVISAGAPKGEERRVASLQRLDVVVLAIERSILPTTLEDADPLDDKSSEDGLMVFCANLCPQ
jgi:hypothetical protein